MLINSEYNVTDRAYSTLSTTDDKYYRLVTANNGLADDSAEATGTIGTDDKVVTFVYEETVKPIEPAPNTEPNDDPNNEVTKPNKPKELPSTDATISLMPIISVLLIIVASVIQKLKSKEQA